MKRFAPVLLTLTLTIASACSEAPHLTRPSAIPSQASFPQTGARIADWSELALSAGRQVAPFDVPAPEAPGEPFNFAAVAIGTTVVLTWNPPAAGDIATSYMVEAGSAPGLSNLANFDTGSAAHTLTVTAVPAGTYFVRVRSRNSDGLSRPSNEVTLVVPGTGPCTAPARPTGLFASGDRAALTLTWNPSPGAITYIIEAGSTPGASNLANFETGNALTSYMAFAVPRGTYYIQIRVRTACGTSLTSGTIVVAFG